MAVAGTESYWIGVVQMIGTGAIAPVSLLGTKRCCSTGVGGLPFCFGAVLFFGGDVKGCEASSDAFFSFARFGEALEDVDFDLDVEFAACFDECVEIVFWQDAIDGRSEAWSEEAILEFIADDAGVAADFSEDGHASGDFGGAEEGGAGHGVVPVFVEWSEGEHRFEGGGVVFGGASVEHADARAVGVWRVDHGADAVPEVVA